MQNGQVKNVIVVSDYGYVEGGAGQIAHQTALALRQAGLRVLFFCGMPPVSEALTNAGIETVCLGQADLLREKNKAKAFFQGIHNKKAVKAFGEVLEKFSPEDTVIHVHTWTKVLSSGIFPVADKRGFRTFITVHDYFLVCPKGGLLNFRKGEICEYKPMSFRCVTCNCDTRSYAQKAFRVLRQRRQNKNIFTCKHLSYIFISEFSQTQFLKRYGGIAEHKRYFLQNPVVFDENRSRVPCESNAEYLFIGRLAEEKGIRLFCEGVTKANVKAIVVGDGELRAELQEKYPQIEFVGWKTKAEMLPYLQRARCLIFPSICYETFGLTAMEGMAYGIPVLCSDLTAASDYVQDGENGFIYAGKDVIGLCEAIARCNVDARVEEMSRNAFETFDADTYALEGYTKKLTAIFNRAE